MFINPKHAIEEGWVRGIKNPEIQIQPNAIDFTLDRVFSISPNQFIISTDKTTGKELKQMRGGSEVQVIEDRRYGVEFFHLDDCSYDILSDVYVDLPEGVACMLVPRSTFARNAMWIVSGLYDSGFKGHVGCVLHQLKGTSKVEKGTRVGQIIFVSSQNAKLYAGGYNHEVGTNAPHMN
jgi:deoxycytidine triphosphate deaminase